MDDPSTRAERPWYVAAFARDYVDVYPHRDLAAARREAAGLVARGLGGRVLDLGCGFGRHSLALRELGLDVFGLDLSLELLVHAGDVDEEGRLAGRLVRGDFRHLPFAGGTFDAVVMLFSSFGYFDDDGNARVLHEAARVLRPGGLAILDLMNPARVRAKLVPESRRDAGARTLVERRRLVRDGRRVQKDVRIVEGDGTERSWREDVRLYEVAELEALLPGGGFELERVEGDFDGRPRSDEAPRQLVWARRR